jgi:putative ABC transport system substrate-binding protein
MQRSVIGLILALGLLLAPLDTNAQQSGKVLRIGYLGDTPGPFTVAFHRALSEHGYTEGQNITIEYRWAEGKDDRLRDLAAELVRLKVEVIVTAGTPASRAAQHATSMIPIVMAHVGNPVETGLVASLARPGGNITGVSVMATELSGKHLELLKEALPQASRIAVLWTSANPAVVPILKELQVVAQEFSVRLHAVDVAQAQDLESAFAAITTGSAEALMVVQSPSLFTHLSRIVDLAAKSRLPAIYQYREWVDAGGLMAYGPSLVDVYRRVVALVDQIRKGAEPADLPVEQVMRFELVLNLKTAKALGLTIPPTLLFQATEVIR